MDDIKKFIHALMIAISNCSLYSRNHESIEEYAKKALGVLSKVLDQRLEIMMIANDLVVNKSPLKDPGPQGLNLMKQMKRHKIMRIDFLSGITQQELRQFIVDMADADREIKAYPHIKTGTVDIQMKGLEVESTDDLGDLGLFASGQVDKFRDCGPASHFRKLHIAGLEEIVMSYIVTFKKEANLLKLLSPVKSYSEYTYTHGTNVAILAMSQVEALGLNDETLHNIGIAALLHDAGKLFVSNEILDKEGELSDAEFGEISNHCLYGARYLAGIERITPLAPIVAYEHHMHYDGSGYPKPRDSRRRQHFCSQIVAIADFYDAMRSNRPYRKSWEIDEILALLRKEAGTSFNPCLVDNFIRVLKTAKVQ